MKLFKILAGMTAFAAGLSLASAAPRDEPADGWVFDAMTAPATVSYTGTVQAVNIANDDSQASVYRIEHRAPNLTERVYDSPPRLHGDSIVTNGDRSYFVDVRRHRVFQTQNFSINDQVAHDDNYLLLRANYRAVKEAVESFDGRGVRCVALVNKFSNRVAMRVRVDEQTKLVLDKQRFAEDGSLISEVRFESVRYTSDIPVADFAVPKAFASVRGPTYGAASKDVAQVVRGAGFEARNPKSLPEGFSAVEGQMIAVNGVPTLHLLYSDGIRTVSLFENKGGAGVDFSSLHPQTVTVSGHSALYVERGPNAFLVWANEPLHFALVGNLRLDDLQRIASSLGP